MTRGVQVICNFMYLIHITNTGMTSSFFSFLPWFSEAMLANRTHSQIISVEGKQDGKGKLTFNFHPAHLGQLPRILYLGLW